MKQSGAMSEKKMKTGMLLAGNAEPILTLDMHIWSHLCM
jgi:hypothetical protein